MRKELVVVALALAAQACGRAASRGAANDPLDYLRVGADPAAEAETTSLALARAGYLLETRLDGRAFVAIAATRRRDGSSVVRVFTARGAAMALDAPDARFPDRHRVSLLPTRAPFELDGAPGEELAVAVDLEARSCLAIVRVAEDGSVAELPLPLVGLPGSPCVERLADVAGDSRPELLTTLRFDAAGLDPAPTVPFPLGADGGQLRPLPPAIGRVFYDRERTDREEAAARATGEERLRLAVELAAIAHLEGRAIEEVVATFDRIAAPVEDLDDQRRAARGFVARGLGLDPGLSREGVLDGPP